MCLPWGYYDPSHNIQTLIPPLNTEWGFTVLNILKTKMSYRYSLSISDADFCLLEKGFKKLDEGILNMKELPGQKWHIYKKILRNCVKINVTFPDDPNTLIYISEHLIIYL